MKAVLRKGQAFSDMRGVFSPTVLVNHNNEPMWVQTNVSYNALSRTFRGMHLQRSPHAQTKLVKVISGSIIDFIVDLNEGSDAYMEVQSFNLESGDELIVPKGFAHGFITLLDNTVVQYLVDAPYVPEADVSINWKSFKKMREMYQNLDMVISEKDSKALMLNEINL